MQMLIRDAPLPLPLIRQDHVRDVYAVEGGHQLLVASDRIAVFGVVMHDPIPAKGVVVTAVSAFWFSKTAGLVRNHLVPAQVLPEAARPYAEQLAGRWLLVRRVQRINLACGVCGYLTSSAWDEYRRLGTVAGEPLPPGLLEAERLDRPRFRPVIPATDAGCEQTLSRTQLRRLLGGALAVRLEGASLCLYAAAEAYARQRGLLLAATTFTFGLLDGELLLIDELLSPDSSDYWPAEHYRPGGPQPGLGTQSVRDHLLRSGWSKQPPPPPLPTTVVAATTAKYQEVLRRLVEQ